MAEHNILLVDDDQELTELLSDYLEAEGLQVSIANSAEDALTFFKSNTPVDLAVFDIMMPGMSGLELLQQLRPSLEVPVIMLTGKGGDIDRILGLEMGADDYLSKPCNPRELLARIRAVLRRSRQVEKNLSQETLKYSGIELDPARRLVTFGAQTLELTSAEFNVLHQFLMHPGEILSRNYLTERVLHRELTPYDRAIDVHVSRVRQKIGSVLTDQEFIKTVRGEGYLLVKEAA
jgi:DNA-binding response OmpR family regulator